ncbi:pirin-like C-terminal cupin domain-containing protein [Rhodococcus pyridinivorans]|uniref:pirin-like C-terminal cupin domain-containing protein n=1 Tax=Rhodococcus pyridinivorans TaxID=103816 RepID=UPI0031F714CD
MRLSFPLLVHLPALRSGCTHAGSSTIDIDTTDGDTPARILTFSGPPVGEPVVLGGPFVMNTKVEITNAFGDFHAGKFGDIPRRSRLQYL